VLGRLIEDERLVEPDRIDLPTPATEPASGRERVRIQPRDGGFDGLTVDGRAQTPELIITCLMNV
jgi:hypothetical protein